MIRQSCDGLLPRIWWNCSTVLVLIIPLVSTSLKWESQGNCHLNKYIIRSHCEARKGAKKLSFVTNFLPDILFSTPNKLKIYFSFYSHLHYLMNSYSKIQVHGFSQIKTDKSTLNKGEYWSSKEHNLGTETYSKKSVRFLKIHFAHSKASLQVILWKCVLQNCAHLLIMKAAQLGRKLEAAWAVCHYWDQCSCWHQTQTMNHSSWAVYLKR